MKIKSIYLYGGIVLIVLVCIFYWINKKHEEVPHTRIKDKRYINSLIDKSLQGDSIAYSELFVTYFLEKRQEEIFYVSTVVAIKYNNSQAYYLLYACLSSMYQKGSDSPKQALEKLDKNMRCLSLFYLLRAYELDPDIARSETEEIFESKHIPHSESYRDSI